jgi:hypothetical protein
MNIKNKRKAILEPNNDTSKSNNLKFNSNKRSKLNLVWIKRKAKRLLINGIFVSLGMFIMYVNMVCLFQMLACPDLTQGQIFNNIPELVLLDFKYCE